MKLKKEKKIIPKIDGWQIRFIFYGKKLGPYLSKILFGCTILLFALEIFHSIPSDIVSNWIGIISLIIFLTWYSYNSIKRKIRRSLVISYELLCSGIILFVSVISAYIPTITLAPYISNIFFEGTLTFSSIAVGALALFVLYILGQKLVSEYGYKDRSKKFRYTNINKFNSTISLLRNRISLLNDKMKQNQLILNQEIMKMDNMLNPFAKRKYAFTPESSDWDYEIKLLELLHKQQDVVEELFMRKAQILYISYNHFLVSRLLSKVESRIRKEKKRTGDKSMGYEDSLKIYEALELIPNPFLLESFTELLTHLDKKEQAIETIEKLIKLNPNVGYLFNCYGDILMKFNEYGKAIEKFEKFISLESNIYTICETRIKMGECYLKLGNSTDALKTLEIGKKLSEKRNFKELTKNANILILKITDRNE